MLARNVSAKFPWVPAGLALSLLLLSGCQSTAYQPAFPDKAAFKVHHLGTYSSKLVGEEEKEIQGTIFQTRLSFNLEKEGSGWRLHRSLDTLIARGYHKLSMPHELEKKVNLDIRLDSSRIPVRIDGYDSLPEVLGRIKQKEEFRKQLLEASDTAAYRAAMRDWWRMAALLPTGVEFEMNQSLPVETLNKTLETVTLDSARYDAMRWRGTHADNRRNCLEYTLHYHRTDSLALLVEQFFFSATPNRKYRKYSWKPGAVKGTLTFSMDRATGLPCFHSRTEVGDITLEFKQEKAEVPIQLIRYEEDIYEH